MEKYEISEDNIVIVDLIRFECINESEELQPERMTDDERFRKALVINGRYFDLETAEEYYDCDVDDGLIYGPIFVNTGYVTRSWKPKNISYIELIQGALLLNTQLKLDELVSKRKILLMPREQLL